MWMIQSLINRLDVLGMKKSVILTIITILACLIVLTGCDPVLPAGNISADYETKPLTQGSTASISIAYPDTENTAVVKWTDQNIEVISGKNIVEVSGLSIKGLRPGTAVLKVKVRENCAYIGFIIDKPIFSTEFKVEVK